MCTVKEVTDANRTYLEKRWKALCASIGINDELDVHTCDNLTLLIMDAQKHLLQTDTGRKVLQMCIQVPLHPTELKDQVLLIFRYAGIKASMMMQQYILSTPLVLAIPSVKIDIINFKRVYDMEFEREGEAFPYVRILGKAQGLNHANYTDLYFCAIAYYLSTGAPNTAGQFVRSNLKTKAPQSPREVLQGVRTKTNYRSSMGRICQISWTRPE